MDQFDREFRNIILTIFGVVSFAMVLMFFAINHACKKDAQYRAQETIYMEKFKDKVVLRTERTSRGLRITFTDGSVIECERTGKYSEKVKTYVAP